jgi:hypothetical protein
LRQPAILPAGLIGRAQLGSVGAAGHSLFGDCHLSLVNYGGGQFRK